MVKTQFNFDLTDFPLCRKDGRNKIGNMKVKLRSFNSPFITY